MALLGHRTAQPGPLKEPPPSESGPEHPGTPRCGGAASGPLRGQGVRPPGVQSQLNPPALSRWSFSSKSGAAHFGQYISVVGGHGQVTRTDELAIIQARPTAMYLAAQNMTAQ